MNKRILSAFRHGALLAVALLLSGPAFAQATRTWVSGVGDDANPCSRTAPCKTFAGALPKTAAGGEISVLDPGGFGSLTINKAITIDGNGIIAQVTAFGVNGITVNAGVGDYVYLRNLVIEGDGTNGIGVRYIAGKSLTLENVSISGFATGVHYQPLAIGAVGQLNIVNSQIDTAGNGVLLQPANTASSTVTARITGSQILNSTVGVRAEIRSKVQISYSTVAGNTNTGLNAVGGAEAVTMSVNDSLIVGNNSGVKASQANSRVLIGGNTISGNGTGIEATGGGTMVSFGDNQIEGNGVDGSPTSTIPET